MKHEQQDLARELYFHTGKTQQEIADILDVNRRTVHLWIKQGRWDEMKTAARQMPALMQQNIYNHFSAVNDQINKRDEDNRCPTMEEVEKMRKLINMANSIKKQHTGAYMEAFQELYQFTYNRDSAFAKELSGHIQAFTRGTIGDKEFITRKQRKDNVLEVTANLAKEELKNYHMQEDTSHPEPAERYHPEPAGEETFCDKNDEIEASGITEVHPIAMRQNNIVTAHPWNPEIRQISDSESDKNEIFCDKNTPAETHHIQENNTSQSGFCKFSNSANSDSESDQNEIFCDKNTPCHPEPVEGHPEPTEGRKPFRIKDYVNGPCPIDDEKYPIPEDFDFKTLSFLLDDKEELTFNEVMKLPIAFRPSPFMDGDTVWVKEMDDVESPLTNFGLEWGVLKMGHTIRRYPDIDTAKAA